MDDKEKRIDGVKEDMIEYSVGCIQCGTLERVRMLAHRTRHNGPIAGWVFICSKCEPLVTGRKLIFCDDNAATEIDRLKEELKNTRPIPELLSEVAKASEQKAFAEAIEIVNNWLAEEKEIAENCHPTNKRYSDGRIDAYELTITALEAARDKRK